MKTKRAIITVAVITLLLVVALVSLEAYYVTAALVIGALIMWHREFWSWLRRRRMPPMDERVRDNTGRAIRNGFIFFAVACALLMLPFSVATDATARVLGALFLAVGAVYMLSYLFYDRVQPKLDGRALKLFKVFLLVAGVSLAVAIVSIFLHNAVYGLCIHFFGADFWERTGMGDEPFFFIIAVIVCPLTFAVGIIGSLVIFCRGLLRRSP